MDDFYRENAALYKKLVDAFDPNATATHFSRHHPAASDRVKPQDCPSDQVSNAMLVVARIRPMLADDLAERSPCAAYARFDEKTGQSKMIDLHDLYHYPYGPPKLKSTKHSLDIIYSADSTTETIFNDQVAELVSTARAGGTGTLFAYGQTGSGKTYTISKLQELAACSLLDHISDHSHIELYITICDLAGNSAFDLLNSRKPVSILQDASGETQLAGAQERRLPTRVEVLDLLAEAAAFRQTAPTLKNDTSSRSHSICRIRIKDKTLDADTPGGLLYLVDLAGSEAARDIVSHGADRMRETREINMSLSVLKECIRGRAESVRNPEKKVHIPVRGSALTRVLKHVFEPGSASESKTVVIACVNPSLADVTASKNTLRYAEMLRASGQV
ncbi:putative kinesin-like protein [Septoria linicola]|nr:putative kinesin-like protein [Septoria linicola]